MSKIETGSTVKVHYKGTFDDGEVFDSSEGRDPLEFTVGSGQVIQGFNDAVIGLEVGGKTTTKITPEDGYGQRIDGLQQTISKEQMPGEIQVGQMLQGTTDSGQPINVVVTEITEENVTVDANHPLAGKTLNFELEVVEVV